MSGQDFTGAPEAQAAHYAQVARLQHLVDNWSHWQPIIAPTATDPASARAAAAAWLGLTPQ